MSLSFWLNMVTVRLDSTWACEVLRFLGVSVELIANWLAAAIAALDCSRRPLDHNNTKPNCCMCAEGQQLATACNPTEQTDTHTHKWQPNTRQRHTNTRTCLCNCDLCCDMHMCLCGLCSCDAKVLCCSCHDTQARLGEQVQALWASYKSLAGHGPQMLRLPTRRTLHPRDKHMVLLGKTQPLAWGKSWVV